MGYLICKDCNGYYKLQDGEKPEDFTNKCACGGNLRYAIDIEMVGENQLIHKQTKNNEHKNKFEQHPQHNGTKENGNKKHNNLMDCPDCGSKISKSAKTCPNCGVKLKNAKDVSPGLALILGFGLGPLGYIYLSRWKELLLGIFVLIILFLLLSSIGTLISAILFSLHQYITAKEMKDEYIRRYGEKVRPY